MRREITTHSPEETMAFGRSLTELLAPPKLVLLCGELGAGKTTLVKGIAAAFEAAAEEDVTSPSFTLVNPYDGRLRVFHVDLYRLDEGASAAHAVDLDEILTDENAVVIIEWAERMGRYPLPKENVWRISITGDGEEPRAIKIEDDLTHHV